MTVMAVMDDAGRARRARRLASRQHEVIARGQLRALGFSDHAISHRVRTGRLRRIHPAVYAVGQAPLTREGRWSAALLWGGPEAALSHSSAAELWKIETEWALVEVTVPRNRNARGDGVRAHSSKTLRPEDVALRAGFRTTTVSRTLIDLAARHSTKRLESAVNAAVRRRLLTLGELREAVAARPGLAGIPHLRRLLDARTFRLTDSELERLFLPLAAKAGLTVPETQVMLNGFRVDFLWSELGLVVETDGLSYHWTKEQQRRDREREHAHQRAGYYPIRFTHEQVAHDPAYVIRHLRNVAARLARRGAA